MLASTRRLFFVRSCLVLWMALATWSAVSANSEEIAAADCEVSQAALDAIISATAGFVKQGSQPAEIEILIDQARRAARPPECDSVRAKILADKAAGLLDADEKSLPVSPSESVPPDSAETTAARAKAPTFTRFDGPWGLGLNMEFIEQRGIRSGNVFDSLIDDKYGVHIGKEFYRSENWLLGGQLHFVNTNDPDVDDSDEVAFDSTSLFATARPEALPALQFKIGVTRGEYENVFDSGTETGLAYGIGLTTGDDDFRIHWLDYEVHRVGDEEFKTVSVNLLIVVCVLGIFFDGPCFH